MCRLFDIHYCVSLCSILRMKSRSAFIGSEYSCAPGLRFTCNCVSRAEAREGREIVSPSIVLNNLLPASLAIVSAEGAHFGRRPLRLILPIICSIRSLSFDRANLHQAGEAHSIDAIVVINFWQLVVRKPYELERFQGIELLDKMQSICSDIPRSRITVTHSFLIELTRSAPAPAMRHYAVLQPRQDLDALQHALSREC